MRTLRLLVVVVLIVMLLLRVLRVLDFLCCSCRYSAGNSARAISQEGLQCFKVF